MVEPIDPLEGGELDRFEVTQGATLANHRGLVQADDGLGQGIVVGIPNPATDGSIPTPARRLL